MENYKKLASDTVLFTISSFGSKFLIFLLLPIYTNFLSTNEFGTVDLVITFVNMLYPIFSLEIAEATLRFACNKGIDRSKVLTVLFLFAFGSTLLLLGFTPFAPQLIPTMGQYWLYIVAIYLGVVLQIALSYYLQGCGKTKTFAVQGILQTLVLLLSNIVFLIVLDFGIKGYLFSYILSYAVAILFMVLVGKIYKDFRRPSFDKDLTKSMLRYSVPMVPASVGWWLNTSVSKYGLLWIINVSVSGIFSAANKIPSMITTLINVFGSAFTLSAIDSYDENPEKSRNFFSTITRMTLTVAVFSTACLILASELLGFIFLAKEFFVGWRYIPYLLLAGVFSGLASYLTAFFRATKKTGILFWSTVIGAALNIGLNILLIAYFEIMGAAVATMISFFVVMLIRWFSVNHSLHIKIPYIKTVVAFLLLLFESMVVTSELAFRYWIGGGIVALLFALYAPEMKNCLQIAIAKVKKQEMEKEA